MIYEINYIDEDTLETFTDQYSCDSIDEVQQTVVNVLKSGELGKNCNAHIYEVTHKCGISYDAELEEISIY